MAEKSELLKRAEDLASQSERRGAVTHTSFLTPAEQYELRFSGAVFSGGAPECERKLAFFLPDWLDGEDFNPSGYICALSSKSFFGSPGHRDYLGAILGLGIDRSRIGDIRIIDGDAFIFCLPSVKLTLIDELTKVGRTSVKPTQIELSDVPAVELKTKELSFTVMSPRLDAVVGDMFSLSRGKASELIKSGLVSLNYSVCEKPDACVCEGDIISLRGKGKGEVAAIGPLTSKGRTRMTVKLFV